MTRRALASYLGAIVCIAWAVLTVWAFIHAALATAREVNAIVAAERERIVAEVKALPTLVLPTGTYVDVEDVFDVIEP